jgi:hypothetical protein
MAATLQSTRIILRHHPHDNEVLSLTIIKAPQQIKNAAIDLITSLKIHGGLSVFQRQNGLVKMCSFDNMFIPFHIAAIHFHSSDVPQMLFQHMGTWRH